MYLSKNKKESKTKTFISLQKKNIYITHFQLASSTINFLQEKFKLIYFFINLKFKHFIFEK